MFNADIVLLAALTTFPVPSMFIVSPAGLPPPAVNVNVPYTFEVNDGLLPIEPKLRLFHILVADIVMPAIPAPAKVKFGALDDVTPVVGPLIVIVLPLSVTKAPVPVREKPVRFVRSNTVVPF